jgi:phospholipid transport system substrate-binding protein
MKKNIFLILLISSLFNFLSASCLSSTCFDFKSDIDKVLINLDSDSKSKSTIENLLIPYFNFNLIGKLSIGKKNYRSMSKEQRITYLELFKKHSINEFFTKIMDIDFTGKKISFSEKNISSKKKMVTIDVESLGKLSFKFFFNKKLNSWSIYDVIILDLSLNKSNKASFVDSIKRRGIDQFLISLKSKGQ